MPFDAFSKSPGFNVCGFISANFGISVAARNTIQLLIDGGYTVSVTDIPLTAGRSGKVHCFSHLYASPDNPFPNAVTIFHLNADTLPQVRHLYGKHLLHRLITCVPFWELAQIPRRWVPVFDQHDIILAPTRFIKGAIESSGCKTPVLHYPQTIYVPHGIVPDRRKWNLPENAVLFVFSFDTGSDFYRKNPVGVLSAFDAAFGDRNDVYFVLKIYSSVPNPRLLQVIDSIKQFAASKKNICILDREMSYVETLSLYASCDVLVSLHRAEGLGLSLMEAMFLGKPVIATAWSGNMDFITPENACPVPYTLVPAESPFTPDYNEATLGFKPLWAEPDLQEAARWMQALAGNSDLRMEIGMKAKKSMETLQRTIQKGEIFQTLETWYHRKGTEAKT